MQSDGNFFPSPTTVYNMADPPAILLVVGGEFVVGQILKRCMYNEEKVAECVGKEI